MAFARNGVGPLVFDLARPPAVCSPRRTRSQPPQHNPPNQPKQPQNLDSQLQEKPYLFNLVSIMTTVGALLFFLAFLWFAQRRRLITF